MMDTGSREAALGGFGGRAARALEVGRALRARSDARAVGVVALRVSGAGLQFVLNVLLGNLLGAAGMGLFLLYVSWSRVLEAVYGVGFRQYVLRSLSAWDEERFRRLGGGLVLVSLASVAACAVATLPFAGLAWTWLRHAVDPWILYLAIAGGAAVAGVRILAEALKARSFPGLGIGLEYVLEPLLLLACVGIVWFLGGGLDAPSVVGLNVGLLFVVLLVGWMLWRRVLRGRAAASEAWSWRGLRRVAEHGSLGSLGSYWGFNLLRVLVWALPFVILPFLGSEREVGLFGVPQRLVALATMILVALSSLYSPRFARAHRRRDGQDLRRDLLQSQLYSFLAYLPALTLFLVVPEAVLGLFGSDFRAAAPILRILACGQAVNAATGLASDLLNMSGNERKEVGAVAVAVVAMLLAGILLGRGWGVMGVAWAFAGALALKSLVSYGFCLAHLRRLAEAGAGHGAVRALR